MTKYYEVRVYTENRMYMKAFPVLVNGRERSDFFNNLESIIRNRLIPNFKEFVQDSLSQKESSFAFPEGYLDVPENFGWVYKEISEWDYNSRSEKF